MNSIQDIIDSFQNLAAQVPETTQPIIVLLAAAIPFIEGEVAALIGIFAGVHPIVVAIAAATGNFLCVVVVVLLTSRARSAVVSRHRDRVKTATGAPGAAYSAGDRTDVFGDPSATRPESKGRQRFKRWLVRFGVPGASILGPLAIPTQFTSAILVAGGTPRSWVLLWQGVAIVLWTSLATASAWAAATYVVGA